MLILGQIQLAHPHAHSLTLETSKEWYWLGTACLPGPCSVLAADVNKDEVKEILTGGVVSNGTHWNAQLRIWHWDRTTLKLAKSQEWCTISSTSISSVCVGDAEGDCVTEIITGGGASDGVRGNAQLRIWSLDGRALVLEKSQEWYTINNTRVYSVATEDIDGDGMKEIITGGGMPATIFI